MMIWEHQFARRTMEMRRSAIRELLKLTSRADMISFAGGLPAPDLFPVQEIEQACDRVLTRTGAGALQYGETEGVAELRDWIADRVSHDGVIVRRENVMIVSGSQQGLDLIGRVLLDPADRVMVENPTYLALLSAWRPLQVQFLSASSDRNGMQVETIEPTLRGYPKLLYCVPNFQNPQGTTLSLERREKLVVLARQYNVGLVEDDPYGELRFEGRHLPSLFSISSRLQNINVSPVILTGTFSKIIAPGLRVGWLIAAERVIEQLVRAKQALDLHTSTFNQFIIYELVQTGFLHKHIPRLRQAYRERRNVMLTSLQKSFKSQTTWTRPEGGMFLMVKLPAAVDAARLLDRALERKVAFVPGEEFHLDGQGRNTLRLNFSHAEPQMIREGMARLSAALKHLREADCDHGPKPGAAGLPA